MSAISNILTGKCPNCGQAYVFKNQNPYNLPKLADMHLRCPNCNKSFEREPGFYFGAMYVSYAITSGIVIVFATLFGWIFPLPTLLLIGIITAVILLTSPLIFRVSRMIWLYWFI
jgi:endogenous inhibitor of DNA gyrase (YacG/DUF329 family)